MDDFISRQVAIDAVISLCDDCDSGHCGPCRVNYPGEKDARKTLEGLSPADVVEVKHGKWTEKEVIHTDEAKEVITEWQSCRCSVCGRYDTRPYMYYFDNPNYCSWCGADMRKECGVDVSNN